MNIFFIYISNAIPFPRFLSESPLDPSHALIPNPLAPASWPCIPLYWGIYLPKTKGLSSHWGLTRPSSATYATRDKSSVGYWLVRDKSSVGYWLVHIVVPPIGLLTPLDPWYAFYLLHWGPWVPSNTWLWASTSVCARHLQSLTELAISGYCQQNLAVICNSVWVWWLFMEWIPPFYEGTKYPHYGLPSSWVSCVLQIVSWVF